MGTIMYNLVICVSIYILVCRVSIPITTRIQMSLWWRIKTTGTAGTTIVTGDDQGAPEIGQGQLIYVSVRAL